MSLFEGIYPWRSRKWVLKGVSSLSMERPCTQDTWRMLLLTLMKTNTLFMFVGQLCLILFSLLFSPYSFPFTNILIKSAGNIFCLPKSLMYSAYLQAPSQQIPSNPELVWYLLLQLYSLGPGGIHPRVLKGMMWLWNLTQWFFNGKSGEVSVVWKLTNVGQIFKKG